MRACNVSARACTRLSLWVWLVSAWSAVLAASCLSVVVAARRSVCWWRNARRLLGRRRLCAVVDCLEDEDFVLLSIAWIAWRRRLCAVVDCLEDEDFVLSSIAWKTRIVCCRRLLGTWIEDGPRDRDSVLSSIAWNVEDDLEMQRAVVDWLGDARTVCIARSCRVAVGWNRG